MNRSVTGITMGDPAGIGPELCLKTLQNASVLETCIPVVFGDISILQRVASQCKLEFSENVISLDDWQGGAVVNAPTVIDCAALDGEEIEPGKVQADCGRAAYVYVETAVRSALKNEIAGIVTAPINKESLSLAGIKYPGHTEILASLCGTEKFCMMMAAENIAVSLVTIHVGYTEVPALLTIERLSNTIELTWNAMRKLGKESPRLTVCGFNPHAGEGGIFGDEEERIIKPVVLAMRDKGMLIEGPLPSDTAFIESRREMTDAYIVMYHDQGLIPFKMLAFDEGVNITLGLPIVRTSVDHGTAFDIAWQGKASPNSLIAAITWARRLSQ